MKRLYTPFKVACIESIGELVEGAFIYVEEVATSSNDKLMYQIAQGLFPHSYFRITASF